MTRREFTRTTKLAAFERAGGCCEQCGRKIVAERPEYDHRIPCEMGGDNSLDNCQVLCPWCHAEKTHKEDAPARAKSRRVRARHVGARTPKATLPGGKGSKLKRKVNGEVVER